MGIDKVGEEGWNASDPTRFWKEAAQLKGNSVRQAELVKEAIRWDTLSQHALEVTCAHIKAYPLHAVGWGVTSLTLLVLRPYLTSLGLFITTLGGLAADRVVIMTFARPKDKIQMQAVKNFQRRAVLFAKQANSLRKLLNEVPAYPIWLGVGATGCLLSRTYLPSRSFNFFSLALSITVGMAGGCYLSDDTLMEMAP